MSSKSNAQPSYEALSAKTITLRGMTELSTKQTSAMQQQALRIAHAMQTTLNVYNLVKRFTQELHELVDFDGLRYEHMDSNHEYQEGNLKGHHAKYQLTVHEQDLGLVIVAKEAAFDEKALVVIENALANLVYPLKNALEHHQVVVHALTCPLTQLGNRQAFDAAIERELEFAKRHMTPLCLVTGDLDKFKRINDTFGHVAGDKVVAHVGRILANMCRNSDIVFRLGGDEFALLLSHTNEEGAKQLAYRIKNAIAYSDVRFEDKKIQPTISLGVTQFQSGDSAQSMYERSDKAMYTAKQGGGNQIQVL